jgi:hypothetical protein
VKSTAIDLVQQRGRIEHRTQRREGQRIGAGAVDQPSQVFLADGVVVLAVESASRTSARR